MKKLSLLAEALRTDAFVKRLLARAHALRDSVRACRYGQSKPSATPTSVAPDWLERGLITPEEWRRWKAGAAARETVSGQGSPTGFSDKTAAPGQLVEDLLAVVKVLKRERRDQADIVEYGPAVIARSQARGWALDLEIERVKAETEYNLASSAQSTGEKIEPIRNVESERQCGHFRRKEK